MRITCELTGLLDEMPTPMMIVDATPCIRWVNRAFEDAFQRTRESLVGVRPPFPTWGPDEVAEKQPFWDTLREMALAPLELRRLSYRATPPDGSAYRCLVDAQRIEAPGLGGAAVLCAVYDATPELPPSVRFRRGERRRRILDRLSRREAEVVGLLLDGLRVPEIARRLFLSQHTVRNHLKSAYRRLGVDSQSELMALASSSTRAAEPRVDRS